VVAAVATHPLPAVNDDKEASPAAAAEVENNVKTVATVRIGNFIVSCVSIFVLGDCTYVSVLNATSSWLGHVGPSPKVKASQADICFDLTSCKQLYEILYWEIHFHCILSNIGESLFPLLHTAT
jgi:hypothetical protein